MGRPATGKTFVARQRIALSKWTRLGIAAALLGSDRSKVINELVDWYLREPGARLPDRPTRRAVNEAAKQADADGT